MTFDVAADAYAAFMGRFSGPLADEYVALIDPRAGQRALDVGCGPGALTTRLVERLGADAVCAIDPSEPFVAAARERFPDVDVRLGAAEELPFPDDTFDLAIAQLVVHFMADPLAAAREMRRVTRPGGVVSASVWDFENERSPLSLFWRAAQEIDAKAPGESHLAGTRDGQLADLLSGAGLREVEQNVLTIRVGFPTFDDWWAPYLFGVGPTGSYLASLGPAERDAIRDRCAALLPESPFELSASAWVAVGRV